MSDGLVIGVFIAGFIIGNVIQYYALRTTSQSVDSAVSKLAELRKWVSSTVTQLEKLYYNMSGFESDVKRIEDWLKRIEDRVRDLNDKVNDLYVLMDHKFRWNVNIEFKAKGEEHG